MPIRLPDPPKVDMGGRILVVGSQYVVQRPDHAPRIATILNTRVNKIGIKEAYISFPGQDKRLDLWIKQDEVGDEVIQPEAGPSSQPSITGANQPHVLEMQPEASPSTPLNRPKQAEKPPRPRSEASSPEREHEAMTRVRNFEDVRFGEYLIKTWYYSPYPLPLDERPNPTTHTPNTPHAESSSSSKKRKLDIASASPITPAPKKDPTITGIESSHKPNMKHGRTVNEMYSGVGKGGEGSRGRLWVCDLCFKYMRTRAGWDRHTSSCTMLQPPGRKVYQRGSYTIWEVDGSNATLYCQNLSLFGKLFIDHKSVFFHVENFLFYVLCDAATSKRDQVMAFFSKEKLSYDDYNLACIVAFPPFQNRGFGKLLIEFSYYLTKHPSTRPITHSPGTPERPLSDLGLKGYTAYWVSVILRFLRKLLADSEPFKVFESPKKVMKSPVKVKSPTTPVKENEGRVLRIRKPTVVENNGSGVVKRDEIVVDGIEFEKTPISSYKGQYSISITLEIIAKACHLRLDDVVFTLTELGFLVNRRKVPIRYQNQRNFSSKIGDGEDENSNQYPGGENKTSIDGSKSKIVSKTTSISMSDSEEWRDIEIVISKEMIQLQWDKWRIREKGVLEKEFVLL